MSILRQTFVVGAAGVLLGLTANHANDDGLDLTRNYFPRSAAEIGANGSDSTNGGDAPGTPGEATAAGTGAGPVSPPATQPGPGQPGPGQPGPGQPGPGQPGPGQPGPGQPGPGQPGPGLPNPGSSNTAEPAAGSTDGAGTPGDGKPAGTTPAAAASNTASPPAHGEDGHDHEAEVAARLATQGLKAIPHEQVVSTFESEMYAVGAYVFVDARDDDAFREGHIPGAFQFDHYKLDRYLADVMPAVQQALKVVVYCNGGDCEDSEFAALHLLANGANPELVHVYVGGIKQWRAAGLPVETGERDSGEITPAGDG